MLQMNRETLGLRSRVASIAAAPSTKAVAIGVATVALAPVVLPLIRPVLKATIKSGVTLFEKTKSVIAETGEVLADIAAEARAEVEAEVMQKASLPVGRSTPEIPELEG